MKRVSPDGGSVYVRRAYALFLLAFEQWQLSIKNGSASESTNQAAYYDARWHLVEAIHEEMQTRFAPLALSVYSRVLQRAELDHLGLDNVRYYIELIEGNMHGQLRVHLFYGGEPRFDSKLHKMRPNPIGKGHGHKIVVINPDGSVASTNEGRRSTGEIERDHANQ